MKTAILGLGIIGERWARNLLEDGVPLSTWNRTPKDFPGFVADPAEAVRGADLIILVVADPDLIESVRPVLSRLSQSMLRIGPLGSASALKLAMNVNIALVMEGLSESLRFARAAGIEDAVFFDALRANVSRSGVSDLKEPKLATGDYAPQFSLKHMDKDLRLALESAEGLTLPLLRKVKEQYDAGMAKGFGDEDFSVLMRLL